MASDEIDYMSDEFLNACTKGNDLRPGLIHSRVKQREINVEKKRKQHLEEIKKSVLPKTLAMDRLQEGLEKPIGPDNKGFSMLQKMGFKPGSSLGSSQTGLTEPIGINVKCDRKGLGREQAIRDLQLKKKSIRENAKKNTMSLDDYRASLSKKYREKDILSDLLKSEKACHKFDTEIGITEPEETWFWPKHLLPVDEDNDAVAEELGKDNDEDYFSSLEKLEMLTLYLRESYLYCIWCGVQYNDEKDLSSSCGGPTREDH